MKNLTKTSSRRMNRKKFQKAGDKKGQAATVVFVLVRKLREREEEMAALTCLNIKYQESGGKKLINSFEKDLGKGRHCGRTPWPPCDSNDRRQDCRSKNVMYESVCRIW